MLSPSEDSRTLGKFQNSSPVRYGKVDALQAGTRSRGDRLEDLTLFDDCKEVSTRDDRSTDSGVETAESGLDGGHECKRLLRVHQILLTLSSSREITPDSGTEHVASFIPQNEAISRACVSVSLVRHLHATK